MANPIKRIEQLKAISREHHHALLLCWKIKTGFAKGICSERIYKYAVWFYTTYLIPHFEIEETYVFPILGNDDENVQQALLEHQKLKDCFSRNHDQTLILHEIQTILENHIRFEERVLFNRIQEIANDAQWKRLQAHHKEHPFEENITDEFWK